MTFIRCVIYIRSAEEGCLCAEELDLRVTDLFSCHSFVRYTIFSCDYVRKSIIITFYTYSTDVVYAFEVPDGPGQGTR
jgi:hypothetical protein